MHPNIPSIIKDIFNEPDPIIWNGIWLETLELLLNDEKMIPVWNLYIEAIKKNHQNYKSMPLAQYIKWEIKAFVALVIKLKKTKSNRDEFSKKMQEYFKIKKIFVEHDISRIIFSVFSKK